MTPSTLTLERLGNIGVLTLNRPDKRNAINIAMRREIAAALESWAVDAGLAVGVILSAGPVFSAGFDVKEFYNRDPEHVLAMRESSEAHHRALAEFPKPLVAGIQGPALGGGFDIAALCDLRLASLEAEFGHPEIKLGAPVLIGPLKELVGGSLAADLAFTGHRICAAEALRLGVVTAVLHTADLRDACLSAARGIAEAPLPALLAVKRDIINRRGGWKGLSGAGGGVFDFF